MKISTLLSIEDPDNYLKAGVFTSAIYDEDCIFEDPTIKFQGTKLYSRNLNLLVPFFDCPSIGLQNIEKGYSSSSKTFPSSHLSSGFNGGFNGSISGVNSHSNNKGSYFKGRGRSRGNYQSTPRPYQVPSFSPGILGPAHLNLVTPFSRSKTVATADGSGLSIYNIGSSILNVPQCSFKLPKALHVPKLS
ncbi:hypothetical protein D5086_024230 [Populus alba]|uniref:Uncharacterized protein n=1 Tax=Populus alba TaxID=43335 RepID=A0ACC4B5E0_POPAL